MAILLVSGDVVGNSEDGKYGVWHQYNVTSDVNGSFIVDILDVVMSINILVGASPKIVY